jgi:DNA repair protein RadD
MTELRPYQRDVIAECDRVIAAGKRRIMIVAPTGSGKTIKAVAIIKTAVNNGQRVLVLAHTREIIKQTSGKLFAHDIPHGIIQAGFMTRPDEAVQVASIQTLWVRAMRMQHMDMPPANLLIIDEAHHCPANTYRKIIAAYPEAVLLGLTATPCRGDGRGLGGIFDAIVECPQVAELIEQKYLVKTRVFAPAEPDLKGVETRVGDYVESQLAERMDCAGLIGDIVTHYHKHGERRKTVCFAVNVAHSVHIRDEFIKSGVRAEHVDGTMLKSERDAALARLESGATKLITNCMVLTEGWDMPEVSCCILARPTKKWGSIVRWSGACFGQRRARSTQSFSTIPAPSSGMDLSRIRSTGRSTPRSDRKARSIMRDYAPATARGCSNARNAAPSVSRAKPADHADSSHSARPGPSPLPRAILR